MPSVYPPPHCYTSPFLSALSGKAANFLLGAILRARRGPRVSHHGQDLSFKWSNISHQFKVLLKLSHFIGIQRFIPLASFLWVRVPSSSKVHKKCLSNSTLLISRHQKLKSNRLKAKRKYIGSYHRKDQGNSLTSGKTWFKRPNNVFGNQFLFLSLSLCLLCVNFLSGTPSLGFHFSQFHIQ